MALLVMPISSSLVRVSLNNYTLMIKEIASRIIANVQVLLKAKDIVLLINQAAHLVLTSVVDLVMLKMIIPSTPLLITKLSD